MILATVIKELGLEVKTAGGDLSVEITGAYISDLLSDVMANSKEDQLWVTLQVHPNIVAVATLKDLAGIILVNGREPEKETLARAEEENIPVMTTRVPTFQLAGKLYGLIGEC